VTLEELDANQAPRWILDGPDSGGVRGIYYWNGVVYFFFEETSAGGLDADMPVERYLSEHADASDVRVRQAIAAIQKLRAPG